jgi:hypothetical protein
MLQDIPTILFLARHNVSNSKSVLQSIDSLGMGKLLAITNFQVVRFVN